MNETTSKPAWQPPKLTVIGELDSGTDSQLTGIPLDSTGGDLIGTTGLTS